VSCRSVQVPPASRPSYDLRNTARSPTQDRRPTRKWLSTSSGHIPSQARATSPLFPSPSPSPTRAGILVLFLGVSRSRRSVNRSVVDRPGSGPGATHEGTPAPDSGNSDGEGCSSVSSNRRCGNRVDVAPLLFSLNMTFLFLFLLLPVVWRTVAARRQVVRVSDFQAPPHVRGTLYVLPCLPKGSSPSPTPPSFLFPPLLPLQRHLSPWDHTRPHQPYPAKPGEIEMGRTRGREVSAP
jgi:hypothetical protein